MVRNVLENESNNLFFFFFRKCTKSKQLQRKRTESTIIHVKGFPGILRLLLTNLHLEIRHFVVKGLVTPKNNNIFHYIV